MDLDAQGCYKAVLSRDRRFDGRFFTGVVTTGVYCRPVCPARSPKLANVRFFACAAAAEEAGFRPCLRCRPETSPGTPAWLGTSATVSRALRLISEGALDSGGVDELAERLGIGSRHLRRLFDEHLGASPLAIAQTHRVHFARKLIDETSLSMTEVALNSGFSSVRRFNHAVRASFGRSPTDLRRMLGQDRAPANGRGLVLRLPYRPPYDWDSMLRFLGERTIPGVEVVDGGSYKRSIAADGSTGIIEVQSVPGESCLRLRIQIPAIRSLSQIVERVRRLFDLGADPLRIASHLGRDPRLAAAVRACPGLRVPGAWDPFELAVRAILGQEVSVQAARTLAGRVASRFGKALVGTDAPGVTHLFPTPVDLARADLSSIGLPRVRAAAVRQLACAVRDRQLVLDASGGVDDALALLQKIHGVGAWTAQYIAMRAFGEPDVLPSGDLGLRRGLSKGKKLISDRQVASLSEAWRPWRAYAAMYIWTIQKRRSHAFH